MKIITAFLVLFLSVQSFAQQEMYEILTNEQIVTLSKVGLSNQLIINKIKASKCVFDLTTKAMITLKENKVDDEIIMAMMNAPTIKVIEQKGADKTQLIINNFYSTGIYYKRAENNFAPLHSTNITNVKKGTTFGKKVAKIAIGVSTVGIVGGGNFIRDNIVAFLGGSKSKQMIRTTQPAIYFYFDETNMKFNRSTNIDANSSGLEEFRGENIGSSSPNDFQLIRIESNSNDREFIMGSYNKNNTKIGVSGIEEINFTYEEISSHLYELKFEQPLKEGEYCFFFTNQSVAVSAKNMDDLRKVKVFDFNITNSESSRENTQPQVVNTPLPSFTSLTSRQYSFCNRYKRNSKR